LRGIFENRAFLFAIAFYLLGIFAYSSFEFFNSRNNAVKDIDAKSLAAIGFAESLLHKKLGDQIVGEGLLTPDEDFLLALELQELAERIPVVLFDETMKFFLLALTHRLMWC